MPAADERSDPPQRLVEAWPPSEWSGVNVLAAVSGGADSMALLRALVEVKRQAGGAGKVIAGHVNHGLRGEESDADERWLCQQCQALGVSLHVRREDATQLAAVRGDGLEEAARESRYRLLTQMAEDAGARFVATAHTRDDQAETVLLRLFRGAGLRGLAGMRRCRPLSPAVALVRPWLDTTRVDLRAYLESLGQDWREDASNDNLAFLRNRLRRELLPYVREHFSAEVDAALARTASLAGEVQGIVEQLAEQLLARCESGGSATGRGAQVTLYVAPLAGQPELIVCEALRLAWRRAGYPEQAMTHAWWRRLAGLAMAASGGGKMTLPGDVLAGRKGELLVLSPTRLT